MLAAARPCRTPDPIYTVTVTNYMITAFKNGL